MTLRTGLGTWLAAPAAGVVLASGAWGTPVAAQEITVVAAGNIEWSRAVKPAPAYTWQSTLQANIAVRGVFRQQGWTNVPYLNRPEAREEISARTGRALVGGELDALGSHRRTAIVFPIEADTEEAELRHPFEATRDLISGADVAFANLEMPLSSRARHSGAYLGAPAFADALRWAGFDVVSTANVHAMDGEVRGLFDTMAALTRAGVEHVGSGADLGEARQPTVIEANGVSIAFLAYTTGGNTSFVNHERAGVMPLDPLLIEEDIRRIRDQVDFVTVSFHWPVAETSRDTHPDARAFARKVIDWGADIVLGHHPHNEGGSGGRGGGRGAASGADGGYPHVPQGIEVYDGGVIFYSLGNFVFGHGHTYWSDNFLARLTLSPGQIARVEIIPVAGRGNDLAQPYVLTGARAQALLEQIRDGAARLGTTMQVEGDVGVIRP